MHATRHEPSPSTHYHGSNSPREAAQYRKIQLISSDMLALCTYMPKTLKRKHTMRPTISPYIGDGPSTLRQRRKYSHASNTIVRTGKGTGEGGEGRGKQSA